MADQRRQTGPKWVIGWREWVGLPDLGIAEIKVKVDTGARSSALHAFAVEPFPRRGRPMVRFRVHPYQRDTVTTIAAEAELIGQRSVRSSSGQLEVRPVIRTRIKLLEREWVIELTLTNRDPMGFRMLLGREALRGRFLVDPGRSFLASPRRRRRDAQPDGTRA